MFTGLPRFFLKNSFNRNLCLVCSHVEIYFFINFSVFFDKGDKVYYAQRLTIRTEGNLNQYSNAIATNIARF